jgi:hypothetical protein
MHGDPYFAWIDESDAFDPVLHRRKDEEIEKAVLEVEEDGFATFTLTVRPPTEGLAKPARKRWGFLSRERADGSLKLLAKGMVASFPLGGDPLRSALTFVCAPGDWEARQDTVLQATKTGPHWDAVMVDPAMRDDPVEILDGLSSVVAFHPATHECQLHDILGVGLPTWNVGKRWIMDPSSLSAEIAEPPISEVVVEVNASWTQKLSGTFDASDEIDAAFDEGQPNTLTPEDFENRWPRIGDGIGDDNGYSVSASELTRVYPDDDFTRPLTAGPFQASSDVYSYVTDAQLTAPIARDVTLDRAWYDGTLKIAWSAEQARTETVRIHLTSGVQNKDIGNGGTRTISIDLQDVTVDDVTPEWQPDTAYAVDDVVRNGGRNWRRQVAGVSKASWAADFTSFDTSTFPPTLVQNWLLEADDGSPIGGPDRDTYLTTERGMRTLVAAALRGRAVLAEAMRCAEITFQVLLDEAVEADLWIGMNIDLEFNEGDLAIEGTTVVGKVVSYRMEIAETDVCEITIRSAPGSGKSTAAPEGTAHASQTGQTWDVVALPAVSAAAVKPMPMGGVVRVRVIDPVENQIAHIEANDYAPDSGRTDPKATDPAKLLSDKPTYLAIDLVPLAAEDELGFEAEISAPIPFEGPRQIDLGG